jgi:hypothetical protein
MLKKHLRLIFLPAFLVSVFILGSASPGLTAARWTFMVYLAGDNNLERNGIDNFIEMAAVGSDANLNIVVQFDRQKADAQTKDGRYGGWTTCKRFLVTKGMEPTADQALADLGVVDMGNCDTLRDFINWAKASYPADHYALVLWDHGSGWNKYYTSATAPVPYWVCEDQTYDTALSMADAKAALMSANAPVDLLGMDACLMNMMEVAYEFRNTGTTVMVGSEETEPAAGWPYHTILGGLKAQPSWTASQLGFWIVDKYYESLSGSNKRTTQSALDLTRMEALAGRINDLANALRAGWKTNNPLIQNQAQQVMTAIDQTVINNKCDTGTYPGAHGLALYFPQDQGQAGNLADYTPEVIEFAGATAWKDFLQDYMKYRQKSWLGNIRWQTQIFSTDAHVDLYDFCQRLAEASTAVPDYIISNGPYSNFNDIAETGTKIDIPASGYARVSLPFPLVFYGKSYQTISVSNSGVIYFDDRPMGPVTSLIPGDNDYGINTFIAPYWATLTYDEGCGVYYQVLGEAPRRSLIVQWKALVFGTTAVCFQAVFSEGSKDIIFRYTSNLFFFNNAATGGLQKDLFTGIQAFRNTIVPATAVQFSAKRPAPIAPVLQTLLLTD